MSVQLGKTMAELDAAIDEQKRELAAMEEARAAIEKVMAYGGTPSTRLKPAAPAKAASPKRRTKIGESGYYAVTKIKSGRYSAKLKRGKWINLGTYDNAVDAAVAVDSYLVDKLGEPARNF